MSDPRLIRAGNSPAFLDEGGQLRRLPRKPGLSRPQDFLERFEDRALFYDCFRHADGERILLVGPPPTNLMPALRRADYVALPSGRRLTAAFHASLSTMITELRGAPEGTGAVRMGVGGQAFELKVQPNHAAELEGRRVLFTMSKDNEPGWIAEWARWHQRLHGTDAIVFFDNGSAGYGVGEIEDTLLGVDGIEKVAVMRWPYRFGPVDRSLRIDPYWSRFLQISSMSVTLRRFAERAFGLINADVDELSATRSGRPLYELARASRGGLVVYRGVWVEPAPAQRRDGEALSHRHFLSRADDARRAASPQRKWTLDPSRRWVRRLSVHPYWHWIEGRSLLAKSMPADAFYWHFRGISTDWKEARTTRRADGPLVPDEALAAAFARVFGSTGAG